MSVYGVHLADSEANGGLPAIAAYQASAETDLEGDYEVIEICIAAATLLYRLWHRPDRVDGPPASFAERSGGVTVH